MVGGCDLKLPDVTIASYDRRKKFKVVRCSDKIVILWMNLERPPILRLRRMVGEKVSMPRDVTTMSGDRRPGWKVVR